MAWMKNVLRIIIVCNLFYIASLCALCQMYFTPRDDIKSHLLNLIKHERTSIDAAVYMLTDKVIAQALVDAYIRGVKVTLVLDQISMGEKFGKGLFLQNNGITVLVHRVENYNPFSMPIMHHKFFIFGWNDVYKKSILWTGSFNCTQTASKLNDENVIMVDDVATINEYQICFKQLIARLGGKRAMLFEDNELAVAEISEPEL